MRLLLPLLHPQLPGREHLGMPDGGRREEEKGQGGGLAAPPVYCFPCPCGDAEKRKPGPTHYINRARARFRACRQSYLLDRSGHQWDMLEDFSHAAGSGGWAFIRR